jgi:hypothetical protein
VAEVEQVLRRATKDLEAAGLRWALVGGLAVSARGAPRFTGDVDFAVAVAGDSAAETAIFQMQRLGYSVRATVESQRTGRLSTARLIGPGSPKVIVDLLFAACGIEEEIVSEATPLSILGDLEIPVAKLGHLLAMKVLARRPQDRIDVDALIPLARPADLALARRALKRIQSLRVSAEKDLLGRFDRVAARRR